MKLTLVRYDAANTIQDAIDYLATMMADYVSNPAQLDQEFSKKFKITVEIEELSSEELLRAIG